MRLIPCLLALFLTLQVHAQSINLGYCNGQIATKNTGTVTGLNGDNATIQACLFITSDMLQAYAKCQIVSLNVGLPDGASYYPETLKAWVRSSKEGDNIASGSCSAQSGWNTIALDNAIDINDFIETGVWIGYTFIQAEKANVLAFLSLDETIANSAWVAKNDKWTDYSSKGVLSIEAVVEGEGLPQRNLAITKAYAEPDTVKIGNVLRVKATIRNQASECAVNPIIRYDVANGAVKGEIAIDETFNYRDEKEVTLTIPTDAITEETNCTTKLEVAWADGGADDYEGDNLYSLPVFFKNDVYYRRMLVEEATGAWCGFCVRGIVGMKMMREKYPDRFVGIGVHSGDVYSVSNYQSWMLQWIGGYPEALVNRNGKSIDPSFEEMESALKDMNYYAVADLSTKAEYDGTEISFATELKFANNEDTPSYKIVYVVCEDKLPIKQTNYYSSGEYGEMGGFENMPSVVDIEIDDVARVASSPDGEPLDLPAVTKDQPYTVLYDIPQPELANAENAYVVAILLDASTGEVVNVARGELQSATGIAIAETEKSDDEMVFNLAGQRIRTPHNGIYIIGGKKVLVR